VKILITIAIVLTPMLSMAADTSLLEIRKLFYEASKDSDAANELNQILVDSITTGDITLQGYKAMALMLLAKHSYNPYKKLDLFNQGKLLLDGSIYIAPENIELRYLRYTVQCEAPYILNYRYALSADLNFINARLETLIDLDLKNRIEKFFIQKSDNTAKAN